MKRKVVNDSNQTIKNECDGSSPAKKMTLSDVSKLCRSALHCMHGCWLLLLLLFFLKVQSFVVQQQQQTKKHSYCSTANKRSLSSKRFVGRSQREQDPTSCCQQAVSTSHNDKLGLYIHLPFCRQCCHYCDFAIVPSTSTALMETYIETLLMEWQYTQERLGAAKTTTGTTLDSIYIGGGTPSLMPTFLLQRLWQGLFHQTTAGSSCGSSIGLRRTATTEVTMELDPGTFSKEHLQVLKKELGVNRLSLGIQSFNDRTLQSIGRVHRQKDIDEAMERIRRVML